MMFYYKSTQTYEVVCKYEHPNLCNMKLIQDEISILILSSPFFVSSIKYMRGGHHSDIDFVLGKPCRLFTLKKYLLQ